MATGTIRHKFPNPHADGLDTTLTRPSNWNDSHDAIVVVEVDFGAVPTNFGSFPVSDANVTAASHIEVFQLAEAATGHDADESEMEPFLSIAEEMAAGTFTIVVEAADGPVEGAYKFGYIVT